MKKSNIYVLVIVIAIILLIIVIGLGKQTETEKPGLSEKETESSQEEKQLEEEAVKVSLLDFELVDGGFQTSGELQINKSVDGNPLTVGGRVYKKGLGVHANSEYAYSISGDFSSFNVSIGIDDEVSCGNSAIFIVKGETEDYIEELYKSEPIKAGQEAVNVEISIEGMKKIFLITHGGEDNITCDHTDWLSPVLIP